MRLAVMGAGAWGTALAGLWSDTGHEVLQWSRRAPDAHGLQEADAVIVALPAQDVGTVLSTVRLAARAPVIITAKGLENVRQRFMHEVAAAAQPGRDALILSGPSFAEDVARGLPTAVTLAAATLASASLWAERLSAPRFRIYPTDDVLGVALGGALKNVLAIACGISDGRELGASARAALIARGFAELSRLGRALGARAETLMGLSGLGDLVLTCSSTQSRNYAFGLRLGQGETMAQSLGHAKGVVEGVYSARAAVSLAVRHGVAMPISEAVYAIVENGARPEDMITQLLSRPVAAEFM